MKYRLNPKDQFHIEFFHDEKGWVTLTKGSEVYDKAIGYVVMQSGKEPVEGLTPEIVSWVTKELEHKKRVIEKYLAVLGEYKC